MSGSAARVCKAGRGEPGALDRLLNLLDRLLDLLNTSARTRLSNPEVDAISHSLASTN